MPISPDTPLADVPFVVFDTETTGLSPDEDGVIEIAGVRLRGNVVQEDDLFQALVNPVRPIPFDAQRVHGITDDVVADAPLFEQVLPQFFGFVNDAVLVAHNATFDLKFVNRALEDMGWGAWTEPVVCTLRLSRLVFPGERRHDLDTLAQRLALEPVQRHRAAGDALQTAHAFVQCCSRLTAEGPATFGALAPALL